MRTLAFRPPRLLTLLVALCYAWLSLATSFQHTHTLAQQTTSAPPLLTASTMTRVAPISGPTRIAKQIKAAAPDTCLACQWQAANTSPAQPVQTLVPTPPVPTPRVVTTLARYLDARVFATTSRGPPSI